MFGSDAAVEAKDRLSQGHITPVKYLNPPPKPGPFALCHCAPGLFRTHIGRR